MNALQCVLAHVSGGTFTGCLCNLGLVVKVPQTGNIALPLIKDAA